MQTQINNNPYFLETLLKEFNGNQFYGLEFILDELCDKKELTQSANNQSNIDWFGLSDLCI